MQTLIRPAVYLDLYPMIQAVLVKQHLIPLMADDDFVHIDHDQLHTPEPLDRTGKARQVLDIDPLGVAVCRLKISQPEFCQSDVFSNSQFSHNVFL